MTTPVWTHEVYESRMYRRSYHRIICYTGEQYFAKTDIENYGGKVDYSVATNAVLELCLAHDLEPVDPVEFMKKYLC